MYPFDFTKSYPAKKQDHLFQNFTSINPVKNEDEVPVDLTKVTWLKIRVIYL